MFLWEKLVAPEQLAIWLERLSGLTGAERIATLAKPGRRKHSFQVYCGDPNEMDELKRRFGGTTRELTAQQWMQATTQTEHKPLSFAGHLFVTGRIEEFQRLRALHPSRPVLCIPAAMAFGTGEHATTAMCLRFLNEKRQRLNKTGPWRLLDLGSGSGILALAGGCFGAANVVGLENDPHAVRTAKENAKLNGVRGVRFVKTDLLAASWPSQSGGEWEVLTANLFSGLLIKLLPQIVSRLKIGGCLIASGILSTQAEEVLLSAKKHDLEIITQRRKGRWVAFLARKTG